METAHRKWKNQRWGYALLGLVVLTGACGAAPTLDEAALETLREWAIPLETPADLTPLVTRAGEAQLVLLGESTHGTSEFYAWRADITKRLVREKHFRFIAVEGDWADLYRLNRYVKGLPGAEHNARSILSSFRRWPSWIWANEETLELVEWLRVHNLRLPMEERTGLYGLDVYGDGQALSALVDKVAALDQALAEETRAAYGDYMPLAGQSSLYANALAAGRSYAPNTRLAYDLLDAGTADWLDEHRTARFHILQSALVILNAEAHYRAMHTPGENSWNPRADHFFLTVERLREHYGPEAKGIVWAHNTHIGDARATPMAARGERNIGMAARTALGPDAVFLLGFGTGQGSVLAGRYWGAQPEVMPLPPGGPGTLEALLNQPEFATTLFLFAPHSPHEALAVPRGHRAVGVVYHPEREVPGNYVPTRLTERYDAFLFIRNTRALRPILQP